MLTIEEMIALAPYEGHFRNAIESDFMRNPGREAIRMMDTIYNRATEATLKSDPTCGVCIMNVLKRVGRLYFEQKAKDEAEVAKVTEKPKNKRKSRKE